MLSRFAHAAVAANELAAQGGLERFLARFTPVNGSREPNRLRVNLSGREVDVPELGLIQPVQLPVKTLKVGLTTMVSLADAEAIAEDGQPVRQLMLAMKRAKGRDRDTELTIEIEFELAQATETQEIIRDALVAEMRRGMEG